LARLLFVELWSQDFQVDKGMASARIREPRVLNEILVAIAARFRGTVISRHNFLSMSFLPAPSGANAAEWNKQVSFVWLRKKR